MTAPHKYAIYGSAVFGLATIALGLIMLFVFPSSADLSEGFRTPIIAFEFAKNDADLAFLSGASETSRLNRQMMDNGHRWDTFFPFAYAGFVALMLLQLATSGHRWLLAAIPVALLIVPFDLHENTVLLEITGALGEEASVELLLQELHIATWLKWGALGTSIAALSAGMIANSDYIASAVSGVAALGIAACWISDAQPFVTEIMSALMSIFFFYFSIKAISSARKAFRSEAVPVDD